MLGSRRNLKRLVSNKKKEFVSKLLYKPPCETLQTPLAAKTLVRESNLQSNGNFVPDEEPVSSLCTKDFKCKLKDWALKFKPSRECCNYLLGILAEENLNVPSDIRTLLPKTANFSIRCVPPGFYSHFGIENQLMSLSSYFYECDEIVFDINVDGIPLFRSSRVQLWPILIRIVNLKITSILPIGVYVGKQKPSDLEVYLQDFVEEITCLSQTGICIKNKTVRLTLRAVVCDAPATSFICGTVGHTSSYGCSKCTQVAKQIDHVLTYSIDSGPLISDEDFKERRLKSRHQKTFRSKISPLEKINLNMVSQVALDSMHLVDLGVVRKFLMRLLNNKIGLEYKVSKENILNISKDLKSLRKYIPLEFARRPRGFEDIVHWKATEFRQFLLYTGILVLKGSIHDELYYEFLLLHCSCRLLSCPKSYERNIKLCQDMLKLFVQNFQVVFKENSVSFNVHSLLHLTDCAKQFGILQNFSAYNFENYLQILKSYVKKPTHILQQIYNNVSREKPNIQTQQEGFLEEKNRIKLVTSEYIFSVEFPDNYCFIEPDIPVQIVTFNKEKNL